MRIAGVALLLFCGVLLGVGVHHLVSTGTCSSTGYSANYGPVPHCPSGTGWWFAFVFLGIIGGLLGALMAGSVGLVFAGIFGGIGFGALSIALDSHASHGAKIFGVAFGACFAIVGVIAAIAVIRSAVGSMRTRKPASPGDAAARPAFATPEPRSAFGNPEASSAFGTASKEPDPILSAYQASRSHGQPSAVSARATVSPADLLPGLKAAQTAASGQAVDELSKLADLHQKGALTDEEFASAKAKLLGQL